MCIQANVLLSCVINKMSVLTEIQTVRTRAFKWRTKGAPDQVGSW